MRQQERVIAALLAACGGRIDIPIGVWEQVRFEPEIKTWLEYSGPQGPRFAWALAAPGVQEIQEQEEAAYAAWRADLVRQALDERTTTLRQEYRALSLETNFLSGFMYALDVIRMDAGLPALPDGGARSDAHTEAALPEESSLETPHHVPEGWITP